MQLFNQFISDVKNQPENHNLFVKQSVDRHLNDLKKSKKKNFPYYFSEFHAKRAIAFTKILRHTKGEFANKLFDLQPYQAFIKGNLFGWLHKETHKRRYTKAYVEMARKGGKTEFAGATGSYMLFADKEQGAEVYSIATKRDQAKICYNAAKSMLKKLKADSEIADQFIQVYTNAVVIEQTESFFKALAADSNTEDGLNPHCVIVDEYHAHPDDTMLKVMETGMGARTQPLVYIITTAGFDRFSPCYKFRNVCINYLNGTLTNESTFAIIFTLDESDDWEDETKWIKSNPNLGNAPLWSYMRTQYQNAINEGSTAEVEFKTKNLNVWTNSAKTWINDKILKKCRYKKKHIKKGAAVTGGLDLSSVRDITSFTLYDSIKAVFETWLFVPEDKVNNRKNIDGIDYLQMKKDGYLIVTPGNVVDYNVIAQKIFELAERYNIIGIAIDRWNSSQLVIWLEDEGLTTIGFGQGYQSMSAPIKEIEKRICTPDISYVFNPMIEWMFSNVVTTTDATGNIKIDKARSKDKVDGVISMIMAYGLSMSEEYQPSVYEERGMVILKSK